MERRWLGAFGAPETRPEGAISNDVVEPKLAERYEVSLLLAELDAICTELGGKSVPAA